MTQARDTGAPGALAPAQIVDAYARLGWKNNDPMGQVLRLRRDDPAALGELVTLFLDRGLEQDVYKRQSSDNGRVSTQPPPWPFSDCT